MVFFGSTIIIYSLIVARLKRYGEANGSSAVLLNLFNLMSNLLNPKKPLSSGLPKISQAEYRRKRTITAYDVTPLSTLSDISNYYY